MSLDQFSNNPESNPLDTYITESSSMGNLTLRDIQSLNKSSNVASYMGICPDGTVVTHENLYELNTLCGKDKQSLLGMMAPVPIENSDSGEAPLEVAGRTFRNGPDGYKTRDENELQQLLKLKQPS